MAFEVLKYDIFGNGTIGGGKVPPAPEVAAPIAFLQLRELPLHLVGRPAFDQPHQITDGKLRWD